MADDPGDSPTAKGNDPPEVVTLLRSDRAEAARAEYSQVCNNFRTLTDIRFKLLGLLPAGTAAGLLWLEKEPQPHEGLVSILGFLTALAALIYNARNDQLYNELVGRAATLERELRLVDGAFAMRPGSWLSFGFVRVKHDVAVGMIYLASIAAWLTAVLASRPQALDTAFARIDASALGRLTRLLTPFGRAFVASLVVVGVSYCLAAWWKGKREGKMRSAARDAVDEAKTWLFGVKTDQRDAVPHLTVLLDGRKAKRKASGRLAWYAKQKQIDVPQAVVEALTTADRPLAEAEKVAAAAVVVSMVADQGLQWVLDCYTNRRGELKESDVMSPDLKKEAITCEAILALLSDAEVAKVSRVEDAPRLIEGDEYVDLEHPAAGVRQVHEKSPRASHALARSAVSEATWAKIVAAVGR
jgi:hypothetical protein